ncbi:Unknown protein sequence [Pseudomonas coronafaciens pv. oryzae]|nr:Unknown protein sequence [Pseudomonas coronafaciens pv. oryzae]
MFDVGGGYEGSGPCAPYGLPSCFAGDGVAASVKPAAIMFHELVGSHRTT